MNSKGSAIKLKTYAFVPDEWDKIDPHKTTVKGRYEREHQNEVNQYKFKPIEKEHAQEVSSAKSQYIALKHFSVEKPV